MLTFDNVRVPVSNILGDEGNGFYQTMQTLDNGRISIGALSVVWHKGHTKKWSNMLWIEPPLVSRLPKSS
ncbi:MAG: hypothetical protein Q9P01_10315 [Anaerolineae bacterium]|nr:hypothetical protein [Anaerolineae bacterium]